MKRNKTETMVEVEAAKYAWINLDEYMKHTIKPTDSQRAAWNFATTTPRMRANVNLNRTWGKTKIKSFTLTERTCEWLEHSTKGMGRAQTASKTVEVALCRYRVWPNVINYITELTTTIVELKKELKEFEECDDGCD